MKKRLSKFQLNLINCPVFLKKHEIYDKFIKPIKIENFCYKTIYSFDTYRNNDIIY